MEYTKESFQKHVQEEHKQSALSEYLREIVYGGSDGIVTTFAVVAGFSGAQGEVTGLTLLVVLLFGLANLFADASSMGLGNILSIRADKDVYNAHRKKELTEIKNNPEQEMTETLYLLKSQGYSDTDAHKMAELYKKNPHHWADFMMQYELGIANPENENALLAGLSTFSAFLIFGAIPLLPYIVMGLTPETFAVSVIATLLALILLGILRWRVTSQTLLRSVVEIVLIGGLSAVIAYVVGTFFRT